MVSKKGAEGASHGRGWAWQEKELLGRRNYAVDRTAIAEDCAQKQTSVGLPLCTIDAARELSVTTIHSLSLGTEIYHENCYRASGGTILRNLILVFCNWRGV